MTDDIVTRLRDIVWDIRCSKMDPDDVGDIVEICLNEIERLRNALAEQAIIHEVQKTNTLNEVERLRLILTHICDVWGSDLLSIIEEMKQFKKDIK